MNVSLTMVKLVLDIWYHIGIKPFIVLGHVYMYIFVCVMYIHMFLCLFAHMYIHMPSLVGQVWYDHQKKESVVGTAISGLAISGLINWKPLILASGFRLMWGCRRLGKTKEKANTGWKSLRIFWRIFPGLGLAFPRFPGSLLLEVYPPICNVWMYTEKYS